MSKRNLEKAVLTEDAFTPDVFTPDAFTEDVFTEDVFTPDAFTPDAFTPDAFTPDAFTPDAFTEHGTGHEMALYLSYRPLDRTLSISATRSSFFVKKDKSQNRLLLAAPPER